MNHVKKLYFLKEDEKAVKNCLYDYLLYQIFSSEVIRQAYVHWPELNWAVRENVPQEIGQIIAQSPLLSNKEIHQRLNEFEIKRAVEILKQYQSCDTPITKNTHVVQNRYNLLSAKGEKALKILSQVVEKNHFSDKMTDLAVDSAHKFLGKDVYYFCPKITKKFAKVHAFAIKKAEDKSIHYMFPAIQLTRGCLNNCSHCDSRAQPVLSHMPWPLFRSIYRQLNRYYCHYPQKETDFYFTSFFADSDMLDYDEPISYVDSGDVGLWITNEKGDCQYLTRGVKNDRNKLALAKALYSGQPIGISFVDTPKEDMSRNLAQLHRTLDTVESVSDRATNPTIIHLHLKSGSSVSTDEFRGYPLEKTVIYNLGRAKDLPQEEVRQVTDEDFLPKIVICPDGTLDWQEVKNNEVDRMKIRHLLKNQFGPQIPKWRLFVRRHLKRTK